MRTRVSERGQITIPKQVRERLGLRPGQVLEVREDEGRVVLTKVHPRSPVDEVYGVLDLGRPTDEILRELRGDGEDPP